MKKGLLAGVVALATLGAATAADARSCSQGDLDGRWQWDAISFWLSPLADPQLEIERCRVTFSSGSVEKITCEVPHGALSLDESENKFSEAGEELRLFEKTCHFKWDLPYYAADGYYMRGQMNQSKDIINGSFTVFYAQEAYQGKFTLTKMAN